MNNIFENAKFGDKFQTRDGRMAIFIPSYNHGKIRHELCIEDKEEGRRFYLYIDGDAYYHLQCDDDIVSRWKEPINEEELDKLAETEANNTIGEWRYDSTNLTKWYGFKEGFKAGYHKAKSE